MASFDPNRPTYAPISNRQRALAALLIALVYSLVLLLLLMDRDNRVGRTVDRSRTIVELLPLPEPPRPRPKEIGKKVPKPPAGAPKTVPVQVDTPAPAAVVAPLDLPRIDLTPIRTAPPAAPAVLVGLAASEGSNTGVTGTSGGIGGDDAGFGEDAGGEGGRGSALPHWIRKVSDDELFSLVAPDLLGTKIAAVFMMRCKIYSDTRVKCRVVKEAPSYPGLRRAVLAAVPLLRMAPGKRNGQPIDGQHVEFMWRVRSVPGRVPGP